MHLDFSLGRGPARPVDGYLFDAGSASTEGPDAALRPWISVVAAATDPCLVLNRSGQVSACSPAAVALLGLPEPTAMAGRALLDGLLHLVDFTATGHRLADWELTRLPPLAALATGALARGLLRLRHGRTTRTVDAVATPLRHGAEVIGSLTFFHPL